MSFNKNKIIGICLILICCFFGYYQFISKPYFSIIVSSYNYGHYLPQTIESILNSTYQNFELIIVNDGSTDKTSLYLKKYKNHPKMTIIEQENQGLSISRNNAMKIARGKFFWFVDADDWIDKKALETLYHKTRNTQLDLVSFFTGRVNEKGVFTGVGGYDRFPTILQENPKKTFNVYNLGVNELFSYPVTSGKQIYRRAFVEKHGIKFPPKTLFEDDVFFFHSIFSEANISTVPKVLYYKRAHGKAITSDKAKHFDSYLRICQEIVKRTSKNKNQIEKAYSLSDYYVKGIPARWGTLSNERKYKFYPELEKMKQYVEENAPKDPYWNRTKEWFDAFFESENVRPYKEKIEKEESI